jgi:hypothetical protein
MTRYFLLLLAVCVAFSSCPEQVRAQSTLPLGQVNLPVRSVGCQSGFGSDAACYTSTVSCQGTQDIGFTYAVTNRGGKDGTVVFFSGFDGTLPDFTAYVPLYTPPAHNFQTVQVVWSSAWENTDYGTGTSPKTAACRAATLMDWLLNQRNVYSGGGMCAQGISAGSAAITYSMSEYGAYRYLTHVELESGPVLSDLSIGCNPKSQAITVCPGTACFTGRAGSWSDSPVFVDQTPDTVSQWTGAYGANACVDGRNISQTQYSGWKAMSVVDGLTGRQADSTFSYPTTSMTGWLCSKPAGCHDSSCQNNSAAQGQLYFQNVTTAKGIYRVDNCLGTEGIEQGTVPALNNEVGLNAVSASMINQCRPASR